MLIFFTAPTNDAFNALPAGTLDTLLDPANVVQLQNILQYHVAPYGPQSLSLTNGQLETLIGDEVTISGVGTGVIKVNDATVTTEGIVASNGIVHVIDQVLIPPQTRPPLATRPPLGSVTRPPIDPPTTNSPTTDTPTIKPTEAVVITPPPTVKVTTLAPITASPTINPVTLAPVTPAPVPLPVVTSPPTPPPQVITTPTTPFPTEVAPPLDTSSPTNLVSRPLESPPPIGGGGGGDTTGGSKDDGWMTAGMPDSSEDYEWVSSDHKDCVEDHTPIFGYSKSSKKSSHWGWDSHDMSIHQTTEGSKDDGWNRNGHTTQGASWMSYDQVMMHFKSKSSKKKCKSHKSSKSKSSKSKVWGKASKVSGKSNKSSKGGGWNYNNALERVDFIGNGGSSSRLQRGSTAVVMFTCLVMGIVMALGIMC